MAETLKELVERARQEYLAVRDTAIKFDPVNGEQAFLKSLRQDLTNARIRMNAYPSYRTDTNFAAYQIAGKQLLKELEQ